MYVDCLLKRGVLVEMATAHVPAIDVITTKAQAAAIIILKQLLQCLDVSTRYVQLEYFHAVVKSVQHVLAVPATLMDLI
jgi:hypothetical protein